MEYGRTNARDVITHIADDDNAIDVIPLEIPSVASCMPQRSLIVGGTARIHPYWTSLTSEPEVAPPPTPNWSGGSIASVTTASAVTFHRRSGSFQAKSAKTGATISGIGPHEMANAEELETNPIWVSYLLQTAQYSLTAQTYLADFAGHHATLGLVVGEVKAHSSYFADPEYKAVMDEVEHVSNNFGITFMKVTGTELYANIQRRINVRRAYDDRFTDVSAEREEAVRSILKREGPVAMSAIRAMLSNDVRTAQSQVHALLCRRVLAYDLNLPVRSNTVVTMPVIPATTIDLHAIAMNDTT